MKTSNLSADNFKKCSASMGRHLIMNPRYGQVIRVRGYPVWKSCQLITTLIAICVQNQFSCAPRLARKCEIEHWFPCGEDGRLEAVGVRSRVQSGMGRFAWLWGSAKNVYQKIRHEALLNNNNNLLHLI